ncbi:MAG: hypothetical protein NUV53_01790 [Patescibacteria group bacterium]|nr:hypothetical protein [Patescibacteria group bacterium]
MKAFRIIYSGIYSVLALIFLGFIVLYFRQAWVYGVSARESILLALVFLLLVGPWAVAWKIGRVKEWSDEKILSKKILFGLVAVLFFGVALRISVVSCPPSDLAGCGLTEVVFLFYLGIPVALLNVVGGWVMGARKRQMREKFDVYDKISFVLSLVVGALVALNILVLISSISMPGFLYLFSVIS